MSAARGDGVTQAGLAVRADKRVPFAMPAALPSSAPTFVLVDDTATFRGLLKDALQRRFQPRVFRDFGDGRDALEACLANPPDLLIADLYLRDMDGRDIVRALPACRRFEAQRSLQKT